MVAFEANSRKAKNFQQSVAKGAALSNAGSGFGTLGPDLVPLSVMLIGERQERRICGREGEREPGLRLRPAA
ncbi:MAG: hypothetical protein JNM07_03820 [Phycisphaerae bacterium]|nr:hypothetical protein [Phycisphaerae bacterium]